MDGGEVRTPVSNESTGCGMVNCHETWTGDPGVYATVGVCTPGSWLVNPPQLVSEICFALVNGWILTPGATFRLGRGAGEERMACAAVWLNSEATSSASSRMPRREQPPGA